MAEQYEYEGFRKCEKENVANEYSQEFRWLLLVTNIKCIRTLCMGEDFCDFLSHSPALGLVYEGSIGQQYIS